MLPKKNRLDKETYKTIFRDGKNYHTPLLMVKYVKTADTPRFSAVVSKKIFAKAHDRNEIRRLMYKAVAENEGDIGSVSAILILKKQFRKDDKGSLVAEIQTVLKNISK